MANAAIFLLSVAIATALHEGGHAMACLLLGFRIEAFSIWPVIVQRTAGSWGMAWSGLARGGLRGFVRSTPLHTEGLRTRKILMILAGPAASASAAAVCMYVRRHLMLSESFSLLTAEIALVAMIDAVMNVIPGRISSDGGQLWSLFRRRPLDQSPGSGYANKVVK